MIFPDNIPLNPLTKGQLWISHYPGKRDIGNKAIQAETDLLELKKRKIDFNLKESLEKLSLLKETEKEIISLVNGYPEILEQCYKNNELHPLCFYLRDLSSKFHSFYNAEKIISDDKDYSDAKIALSIAIKEIINNGLNILGIGCPEKM